MLRIGEVIDDKYEIMSVIGKGGMSVVYLAINRIANRQWAIKEVIKNGSSADEVVKQNLIAEIDMLKRLSHENLPRIIDVIDSDEYFLIVMDYIEGRSLKSLLDEKGAQPQDKVVEWAIQLTNVLEYLHSQNPPIIYRDMKPGNIMLRPNGKIALIDFGTAREYKRKNNEDTTCLGTPGYAAPEQYKGENHRQTDVRTDIYSLGATMYHLVTNHHPNEPPYVMRPITGWNGALSKNLERIILKCTQPTPIDRYKSCLALRYDLEHYQSVEETAQRHKRNNLIKFSAMLLISAILTFTAKNMLSASEIHNNQDYYTQLEIASISNNYDEKLIAYISAISIMPENELAYNQMLNTFISKDTKNVIVLDEYENNIINSLYGNGLDKIIDELCLKSDIEYKGDGVKNKNFIEKLKKNPITYGEYCYNVGMSIWNYYYDDAKAKSMATSWFSQAYEYLPEQNTYKSDSYICMIITEYSSLIENQPDDGVFAEYLSVLKDLENISKDLEDDKLSKTVKVKLYGEILDFILQYKSNLKTDNVSDKEILDLLENLKVGLNDIESNNPKISTDIQIYKVKNNELIYYFSNND